MGLKTFRAVVRNDDAVVRDHAVHGIRVLPGVALLDLIYRIAIAEGRSLEALEVRDLLFHEPIATTSRFDQEIRVEIEDDGPIWSITILARRIDGQTHLDPDWVPKAQCVLYCDAGKSEDAPKLPADFPKGLGLDADLMYEAAHAASIVHGEFFRVEGTLHPTPTRVNAELRLSPLALQYRDQFALHPAFLDAATLVTIVRQGEMVLDDRPLIPLFVGSFRAWRQTADACRVVVDLSGRNSPGSDTRHHDIQLYDHEGNPVAVFRDCVLKQVRSPAKITGLEVIPAPPKPTPRHEAIIPLPAAPEAEVNTEAHSFEPIVRAVREVVARSLGRPEGQVDPTLGFYQLGLDSSSLLQIAKTLEARLRTTLYPTLLFEYPTVFELSRYLSSRVGDLDPSSTSERIRSAKTLSRGDQASPVNPGEPTREGDGPVVRYNLIWRDRPLSSPVGNLAGPWLVLAPGRGIEGLTAALRRSAGAAPFFLVEPGVTFARIGEAHYQVNPSRQRDLARLLGELKERGQFPEVVVHAWNRPVAAAGSALEDESVDEVDRLSGGLVTGILGLRALIGAWLEVWPTAGARLLSLCGAEGKPHDLAVSGFFRTLRREHPGLRGRVVGLETPVDLDRLAAVVRDELLTADKPSPDAVLYRGGRRLARALGVAGEGGRIAFRAGGVYLITGGAGGLGLALAEYLARDGHARLALFGRGALGPEREERVERLRKAGSSVLYIRCDVERPNDLEQAVARVRSELGPIRGVVHAAGIVEDAYLRSKSARSFERVLGPKVIGTVHLDRATRDEPLDWFVMCSSVASVLGNPGQGDYAFANAFLDHFAAGRESLRGLGRRQGATVSINWPLILGAGLGVSAANQKEIRERFGLLPLTLVEAIETLPSILSAAGSQILVLRGSTREIEGHEWQGPADELAALPDPAPQPTLSPTPAARAEVPAPIAIIGLAGQYPMASNPVEFWSNLRDGVNCIREIPTDRWDYRDNYDPSRTQPGGIHSKWGGFITDHDCFDSLFFHIAPREARAMDPQERLFLQAAWSALEDAGYPRQSPVKGDRKVGVFVGVMWGEYQLFGRDSGSSPRPASWFSTIANRVSYNFDFQGPSLAVDTACSSSLVAIHLACDAIRRGECRAAVAGGVNLSLHPNKYVKLSQMQMLSPTGQCRSFGAGADGYVPGEGVGAVVLKSLEAALADGDPIHGVILASSVNHGGRTGGYTVPSPSAQSALIAETLERGRIDPVSITYVEAHGTGTALGDPIEVAGLAKAFGGAGGPGPRCTLGSVKSNIGHLESAAGIAGLTKVLLQFRHGLIAPTLHCEPVNPEIDFESTPFRLAQNLTRWEPLGAGPTAAPRRAGLSSFGAGGVNAFLVVEEPPLLPESGRSGSPGPELIVLSARTEASLHAGARTLGRFLGDPGSIGADVRFADVAHTLQVGREAMAWRLAFVASSIVQVAEELTAFAEGRVGASGWSTGRVEPAGVGPSLASTKPSPSSRLLDAADAWVHGATVDWSALVSGGPRRRVMLPTYQFERAKHWFEDHREDLGWADRDRRLTIRRHFTPADEVARDHLLRGVPVVPAAVLLDMALEAGATIAGARFLGIAGLRLIEPVFVKASVEVELDTKPGNSTERITFEVRTRAPDGSTRLHARGDLLLGDGSIDDGLGRLDPDAIRRSCSDRIDRAEIDRLFQSRGIGYGPSFCALQTLFRGDREVLGLLTTPRSTTDDQSESRGRVSQLDAALQGAVGFIPEGDSGDGRPMVPRSIGSVVCGPRSVEGKFVRACLKDRRSDSGAIVLDVAVADDLGRIVLALKDVELVSPPGVADPAAASGGVLAYYYPCWRPEPVPRAASEPTDHGTVLIVGHEGDGRLGDLLSESYRSRPVHRFQIDRGSRPDLDAALASAGDLRTIYFLRVGGPSTGDSADLGSIEEAQERGLLTLFRLVKAIGRSGLAGRGVRLKVITRGACRVRESEPIDPGAAALVGLVRAVRREYRDLSVSLIDVPTEAGDDHAGSIDDDWPGRIVLEGEDRVEVALRVGSRFVSGLERFEPPITNDSAVPIRRGGVFVVLGGAGGLGFAVASAMAARAAGHFVLVGRRPINDEILAKLAKLGRLATSTTYLAGDVTDLEDMERIFAEVRTRFGAVHGVIHSVGIRRDIALERTSEADFQAVLAAKVVGTTALDRATRGDPLDFLAFFSSAAPWLRNVGQAGYLAGCTYQDAYGNRLSGRRGGRVWVINWGYWGEVGAVATPEYRERLARRGVYSIGVEEGVAAFFRCLGGDRTQVLALKADETVLSDWLAPPGPAVRAERLQTAARTDPPVQGRPVAAPDLDRAWRSEELLDRWCVEALGGAMHRWAGAPPADVPVDRARLATAMGILPKYRRLFEALLALLSEAGHVAIRGDAILFSAVDGPPDRAGRLEAMRRALREEGPGFEGRCRLADACLKAIPDVMSSRRSAPEVLFPNASPDLVRPAYDGSPIVDAFNLLAGQYVRDAVDQRETGLVGGPFRVLEIGAGTGATSTRVLEALVDCPVDVEYHVTDISPAFTRMAGRRLGGSRLVQVHVLDIERPVEDQGFDAGTFDVVLAAHVMHATADLNASLGHAKRLLKPGGVLLLNEPTQSRAFFTCTFGLTEGWWRRVDGGRRPEDSPLLGVDHWQQVLDKAGFRDVRAVGLAGSGRPERWGQVLLLGKSDSESLVGARTGVNGRAARPRPGLASDPDRDMLGTIEARLRALIASSLEIPSAELEPDRSLADYGLDSITGVDLIRRINGEFALELRTSTLFEYPNVRRLSAMLQDRAARPVEVIDRHKSSPLGELKDGDAIAVIGMSARFPGAGNIDEFWDNLAAGRDSITPLPEGRWGTLPVEGESWGGFLEGIDCFDPLFFNISGAEAELMDPQQRLFLEQAWSAFEHSGYSDQALAGTRCGVYVGAGSGDYQRRLDAEGVPADAHMLTGNHVAMLAARIAYWLDLKGPSLTVDTACSSSLVALHLACQAIHSGDCDLALAGGVFVVTTPTFHTLSGKAGMLSPGHRCRSFAADADGFVPGEGVAAVVLKPLNRALADGDQVWGIIRGSAINQDGHSNGITAPSPESQTRLIRGLYEREGIDPDGIDYVEAHGTGTALGDPIEVEALSQAFRSGTARNAFCALGSVKTNIGHTVYAAGMAGLIKVLLSLRHGQIPPSLHFDRPNQHLDLARTPFFVNRDRVDWARALDRPRRAAISSFGFSGTNSHVVIEEAPSPPAPERAGTAPGWQVVALSAKTKEALDRRVADLAAWLGRADRPDLCDIACTLATGRAHFAHRLAIVTEDVEGLSRALAAWSAGREVADAQASGRGWPTAERSKYTVDGLVGIKDRLLKLAGDYASGAEVDWPAVFGDGFGRRLALPTYPFERGRYGPPTPADASPAAEVPVTSAISDRPESTRLSMEAQLRLLLAEQLKIDESALKARATWDEYGVDSMSIVKLNRALERAFGRLPKTLFFEYRTLADLAAYLATHHASMPMTAAPLAPAPNPLTLATAPAPSGGTDDGIAVIGLAGRYPGADDLDEFWHNLVTGKDCITEVPPQRWDHSQFFSPDRNSSTTSYGRWGGFLSDVDAFDPLFFGISPREAERMDPQERLFLQSAWHAIEDAGYTRTGLARSRAGLGGRVGVFVGVTWGSYQLLGAEEWARGRVAIPAGSYWTIANRVSHALNLNGPSFPIDTACSSSLTAIHLACEAIRRDECSMAIAGGVNLYLHPSKYVGMSQQEFLSTDGRCRSFGRGGDGFVPGEGVGVVVLKPLRAALADGDRVIAIIKGSAINHGGKAGGYSVPNPLAQAELIATTLTRAGVAPRTISYVEAHGTGTALGDPIEVAGLCRAFGQSTSDRQFCAIGSVKSNIGHLESAAGIAGLTKVLLQLKHKTIVPSLHAQDPNANLDLDSTPFRIQQELADWSSPTGPRRASISAFGAGGSNAHLILEEPGPMPSVVDRNGASGSLELVPLSARDPDRLRESVRRLHDHLIEGGRAGQGLDLRDIAYTLQVGREPLDCRASFLARSLPELILGLDKFLAGGTIASGSVDPSLRRHGGVDRDDAELFRKLVLGRDWNRLADHWEAGAPIDWADLRDRGDCRRVSLPGYPFARERYWLPVGEAMAGRGPKLPSPQPSDVSAPTTSPSPVLGYFDEEWVDFPPTEKVSPSRVDVTIFLMPVASEMPVIDGQAILVTPGAEFRRIDRDRWEIDPDDAQSYHRLTREAIDRGAESIRVVHLNSLAHGEGEPGRLDALAFADEVDRRIVALFHLSRELLIGRPGATVEIVFGHVGESPAVAAVRGFLRTLVKESSTVSAKVIGLDRRDQPLSAALGALAGETGTMPGRFVAIRLDEGKRRRRILRPCSLIDDDSPGDRPAFRPEGVYVITGGAGKIAADLARDLSRHYRARLVLLGRSRLDKEKVRLLRELGGLGGSAIYVVADVGRLDEVTDALGRARRHFGRIDGVIHVAGVIEDALIVRKDLESFRRVLAPKVAGTICLDEATRDDNLDLFLLFSSLAGVVGNTGQADYAAANGFLDGFATQRDARRDRGERKGRSLSIGWPYWRDGGMQIPADRHADLLATGLVPMPTTIGLEALGDCLRTQRTAVTVVYGHPTRLEDFLFNRRSEPPLDAAPEGQAERLISVQGYLKGLFADELKLLPEQVDAGAWLDDLGVDSVVIRKLGARLDADLGTVPRTALFEHRTIISLANYLIDNHPDWFSGQAIPAPLEDSKPPIKSAGSSPLQAIADESAGHIAIIGLSGRYPGSANLTHFWENLQAGRDCITEIPKARWDADRLFDPGRARPGSSYCKWGGFLDDVDRFDALFFNIAPRDAELMDPQERLFLEVAWQAVEDAGHCRESLGRNGGRVGVFVGVTWGSYQLLGAEAWGRGEVIYPNSSFWSIANRVSHVLDLHGPSLAVDTACSSSLTAIHLAVESLRRGECRLAIAGGVNLYLHPSKYARMCQQGFASSDGKCRSFGVGGEGYVPGEGVGAVLLRPMADAIRDRDHILGVIKGSAVNHGGRTNGYTVPNPAAQADLIQGALANARIDSRTIGYVEAHGTGTPLGDPIEVEGLTRAFGLGSVDRRSCAIGSVKSNIGHLESAAGIAGLTKVLLQLKHKMIVPSLHAEVLNPDLRLDDSPFAIQRELSVWVQPAQENGGCASFAPRRAGISSFGAGGSNAHLLVEEYDDVEAVTATEADGLGDSREESVLVVLSARTADRLRAVAANLREAVAASAPPLRDLAWTLQVGREAMRYRLALVVVNPDDLTRRLDDFLAGREVPDRLFVGTVVAEAVERGRITPDSHISTSVARLLVEHGRSWVGGGRPDWGPFYATGRPPRRVPLPPYPFRGERHWIAPSLESERSSPGRSVTLGPMIDRVVPAIGPAVFETQLDLSRVVVGAHRVGGRPILAGVLALEMACEAAALLEAGVGWNLERFAWLEPLAVGPDGVRVLVTLTEEQGGLAVHLKTETGSTTRTHGIGHFRRGGGEERSPDRLDPQSFQARADRVIGHDEFYSVFQRLGIEYGSTFRGVEAAWTVEGGALGRLRPPDPTAVGGYLLVPTLLDGAFQLAQLLLPRAVGGQPQLYLPSSVGEIAIHAGSRTPVYALAQRRDPGTNSLLPRFDIMLFNEDGEPSVRVRDFCVQPGTTIKSDYPPRSPSDEADDPIDDRAIASILQRLADGELTLDKADRLLGSSLGGEHS